MVVTALSIVDDIEIRSDGSDIDINVQISVVTYVHALRISGRSHKHDKYASKNTASNRATPWPQ
jgi:hypothetical protein